MDESRSNMPSALVQRYTIRKGRPTREEFRDMLDAKTNRVVGYIAVSLSDLTDGLDALNDRAEEMLLPEGLGGVLSNLDYGVVGFDPPAQGGWGTIHLRVDAEVNDIMGELDD